LGKTLSDYRVQPERPSSPKKVFFKTDAVGSVGVLRSQREGVVLMKIGAVINATAGTLSPEAAEQRLQQIKAHLEAWVEPGWLAVVPGQQVATEIERLKGRGLEVLGAGGIDRIGDLETRRLLAVTIHTRGRWTVVAIDGENRRMDTPLRFKIRRQSLRVVGP
jgi:hypothetical protein